MRDAMRRVAWVGVYAIAMALVEAAVVVYLRSMYPGGEPIAALNSVVTTKFIGIELAREAATMVMLVAVAALAARGAWERFLYFSFAFGAWDIFYYVWLWVYLRWPTSLLTWDVLFLIPVPWIAPVLAPVVVSIGLIGGALWLLMSGRQAGKLSWALWVAGAAVILASFIYRAQFFTATTSPSAFNWLL